MSDRQSSSLDLAQCARAARQQEFEDRRRRRRTTPTRSRARAPRLRPAAAAGPRRRPCASRDPSPEPGAAGTGGRLSIDARMKQLLNWLDSAAEEARRQSLAATAAEPAAAAAATAAATGAADASAAAVAPPPSPKASAPSPAQLPSMPPSPSTAKARRPRLLRGAARSQTASHHRTGGAAGRGVAQAARLMRKAPSWGGEAASDHLDVGAADRRRRRRRTGGGGGSVRALALRADDCSSSTARGGGRSRCTCRRTAPPSCCARWTRDEVERGGSVAGDARRPPRSVGAGGRAVGRAVGRRRRRSAPLVGATGAADVGRSGVGPHPGVGARRKSRRGRCHPLQRPSARRDVPAAPHGYRVQPRRPHRAHLHRVRHGGRALCVGGVRRRRRPLPAPLLPRCVDVGEEGAPLPQDRGAPAARPRQPARRRGARRSPPVRRADGRALVRRSLAHGCASACATPRTSRRSSARAVPARTRRGLLPEDRRRPTTCRPFMWRNRHRPPLCAAPSSPRKW